MGSEHYCLRWNNHQSNLLGVFSQLLQDESLVDVTLACSEGAPIRAHKVVLSACSSYFQSLFLDHPERHPIVILKDVRFAELQTLVEFMYKGEVNVQYCQLSALLKTAESLKVKGLAEMTNQNTTLREPEREPDRLRPQPGKTTCGSPVDAALAGPSSSSSSSSSSATPSTTTAAAAAAVASSSSANATHASAAAATSAATASSNAAAAASGERTAATSAASSLSLKRDASDRCSPSPPKRLLASSSNIAVSPVPLDLYQRRPDPADASEQSARGGHATDATPSTSNNQSLRCSSPGAAADLSATTTSNNNLDERDFHSPERLERPPSISLHRPMDDIEEIEDVDDDYDEEMEDDDDADNSSNEMGLNLKNIAAMVAANTAAAHRPPSSAAAAALVPHSPLSGAAGADIDSARSTPAGSAAAATTMPSAKPADLTQQPASRSARDGGGAHCSSDRPSSSGAYALPSTSTHGSELSPSAAAASAAAAAAAAAASVSVKGESMAGTSGLGPVQSVPLSLKKEIDCSEDDNSNSRHMLLQPRSASAGGGLGGGGVAELDYRATHDSETSESPHGLSGAGGGGTSAGAAGGNLAASSSASLGSSSLHEQQQQQQQQQHLHLQQQQQRSHTPPPIYPCVYCGATFPHQSKLTRHILSHSLKTLEYRETTTHALLHPHLLTPHDLNLAPLPQQFAYQMNAAMQGGGDPQEQAAALAAAAAMEMESFAAAVAASGVCGLTGITGCGRGGAGGGGGSSAGLDLDGGDGGRRCSSTGNGGIGSGVVGGGGSGLLLSGAGSSSSSAAGGASTSSALLGSGSDPNSVVLCKFCGKSFPDVASLITHLPVHTGERPFKCEFCGKAFKLRHHMKDHCRVHTGERPFRCHMCGKTFSRSTILKAHEKTHFPKYVRKFLSPSPVETKDELPQ